jgi:osmoprotectant transport system permease protein
VLILCFFPLAAAFVPASVGTAQEPASPIRIGSKAFPESVILGDMVLDLVSGSGSPATHRRGLGGTSVLWQALLANEIDVYPEYTGTLSKELLAGEGVHTDDAIRQALARRGLLMSRSLGFNNTYAIGMSRAGADARGITSLSDLRHDPELRFGFSNEFLNRVDGWPGLRDRYRLPQRDVRGLEHALTYPSLKAGKIDATDLYSTDAEIQVDNVKVLVDDLHYFPAYEAILVYRRDLVDRSPAAVTAFLRLEGRISAEAMQEMNARAKLGGVPEREVADDFVRQELGVQVTTEPENLLQRLIRPTEQHLVLVAVSLAAAVLVAVPLGILSARRPRLGQIILAAAGIIQTVPSLALLVFMIPLLGIGSPAAIVALFLYSLLPIVRNTYAGLQDIPTTLRESALALGLPAGARLRVIELPLASRSILAGIKTSAVINVGTATLGALIGAGGYGETIMTGVRLNDLRLILEGAVPAALLALLVQGLFELAERGLVPRGLRLKAE